VAAVRGHEARRADLSLGAIDLRDGDAAAGEREQRAAEQRVTESHASQQDARTGSGMRGPPFGGSEWQQEMRRRVVRGRDAVT
jgi:hypothetical protein